MLKLVRPMFEGIDPIEDTATTGHFVRFTTALVIFIGKMLSVPCHLYRSHLDNEGIRPQVVIQHVTVRTEHQTLWRQTGNRAASNSSLTVSTPALLTRMSILPSIKVLHGFGDDVVAPS